MREALALIHLSPYESLGIVLLEAMASRTPVLVHADSEVMVEHCRRSGAGIWLRDEAELAAAVRRLSGEPGLAALLGERGRCYVDSEFSIECVRGAGARGVSVRDRALQVQFTSL